MSLCQSHLFVWASCFSVKYTVLTSVSTLLSAILKLHYYLLLLDSEVFLSRTETLAFRLKNLGQPLIVNQNLENLQWMNRYNWQWPTLLNKSGIKHTLLKMPLGRKRVRQGGLSVYKICYCLSCLLPRDAFASYHQKDISNLRVCRSSWGKCTCS